MNILHNIDISRLTTMGVGGTVKYYAEPVDAGELNTLIQWAQDRDKEVFILGGGSDVIFDDREFDMLVINMKNFENLEYQDSEVVAGAGVILNKLIRENAVRGLSGMEELYGIPGTVGGAITKNAGAHGREIKDVLSWAKVIVDIGTVEKLSVNELGLEYRESSFEGILIEAGFRLTESSPESVQNSMKEFLKRRNATQPKGKTAGCIFKNPEPGLSAGYLLDQAGMKGYRIGDAMYSTVHANFIVNLGSARAEHIFELIDTGKRAVFEKFGVKLEEEVVIIR